MLLSILESKQIRSGLFGNSSSTSQVSFSSTAQDRSSLLSSSLMAQQVLDDFLKPNQPLQFDQFCSENFSTGKRVN